MVSGLLLNKAALGRNTLAIDDNEEVAHLAGVSVVRTRITTFMLSGLVSAVAGIILASRVISGQPTTSTDYRLIVISACMLGGTLLRGGIGKIFYMVVEVLVLRTVGSTMSLLNISPSSQYVVRDVIPLAVMILGRYKQKARRAA